MRRYCTPLDPLTVLGCAPPQIAARAAARLERFVAKIELQGDHWVWTGTVYNGNQPVASVDHQTVNVARMVSALVHGPLAPGVQVRRSCGNLLCVAPRHLVRLGPQARTRPRALPGKLQALVADVLARVERGESRRAVARDLRVAASSVSRIASRKSYANGTGTNGAAPALRTPEAAAGEA